MYIESKHNIGNSIVHQYEYENRFVSIIYLSYQYYKKYLYNTDFFPFLHFQKRKKRKKEKKTEIIR